MSEVFWCERWPEGRRLDGYPSSIRERGGSRVQDMLLTQGAPVGDPQGSRADRRLPPPPPPPPPSVGVGVGVEMGSGCCPATTYGIFFAPFLPPVSALSRAAIGGERGDFLPCGMSGPLGTLGDVSQRRSGEGCGKATGRRIASDQRI